VSARPGTGFAAAALLGALVLTGCGGTGLLGIGGKYQPVNWAGMGYDETQLAPNVFRVSYMANMYTSPSTATDLALLRAAELTLEKGYDHFAIVNGADAVQVLQQTTPIVKTTTDVFADQIRQREVTVGQHTYTNSVPSSSNTIVCFKGVPRNVGYVVMDAKETYAQITAKHGIKANLPTR
jgi:hypothetical protein